MPATRAWLARVRRLVDDDETAHEIASEAFTRLLARWSSLDNPQSYLYMIATNLIRDHWRKVGRERRALRAVSATIPAESVYHPAQDVDVRALIQGLPDRLRQPFLLHYYGGFFDQGRGGDAPRRPEGTVKADLHHALSWAPRGSGGSPWMSLATTSTPGSRNGSPPCSRIQAPSSRSGSGHAAGSWAARC